MPPEVDFSNYIVFMGIPDDRMVMAVGEGLLNRPSYNFPGTASFLNYLDGRLNGAQQLWFGPPSGPISLNIPSGPMVNHLADPDLYGVALDKARRVADALGGPCFNAPDAVLANGRDRVAEALSGLDGVVAPRTVRLAPSDLRSLTVMLRDLSLTYPLLIRPVGAHGGQRLLRIDTSEGLADRVAAWMFDAPVYVTEFHDFADPDGVYRKHRLAVVGDKVVLRSVVIGDDWLLHAARQSEATRADEAARLAAFESEVLPRIAPAVAEIARRLSLDLFGIDCHLDADGRLLIFEANACMSLLLRTMPPPNMWEAPVAAVRTALLDLLAHPERWRRQGERFPTG
ncbi:hypothetical protein [Phenylobacterium sp.]|uniref:ATP-grasp domain-containing protein n=1 Tax=Phenylobacterium sp. TaxID=1871053 RepID=UPI0030F42822